MKKIRIFKSLLIIGCLSFFSAESSADENLFGYVRGSETLPASSWELYQILTSRTDKGAGKYQALDSSTELEYGFSDKLSLIGEFKMQSINVSDLIIDAYIPKDNSYGLKPSGLEIAAKYNFLSPAKDDLGLTTLLALEYTWLDRHSGQGKDSTSVYLEFLFQKYFLEGQLIGVFNLGMESTYADRHNIENLPPGFEWPTEPEMEIALKAGSGISYRFISNWFIGTESVYESEYETAVGQERYSTFIGPTLHYGSEKYWGTLTWFSQINGGGPPYPGQENTRLHLIEKTKQEVRLKIGYNF